MGAEFTGDLEEPGKPYNIKHRAFYFARDLNNLIVLERSEYVFRDQYRQLANAGTSIGANVVEGRAGVSKKDFLNFNGIALKSANETKYWLKLLIETVGKDQEGMKLLLREAVELSKIIATIIINSKNNDKDD